MPIHNRHIAIDDLDRPNQPLAYPRPDYRSNDYKEPKRAEIGPRFSLFLIGAGVIFAGLLAYLIVRVANYVAYVNEASAPTLDYNLLRMVKVAIAIGAVAVIAAGVLLLIAHVAQRLIVRMQNSQPVSVFDVLGGWRNNRSHAFGRDALQWYHTERSQWAQASLYWSLNTLDTSRTERNDNYAAQSGVIDVNATPVPLLPDLSGNTTMLEHLLQAGLINRSGNSLLVGMSAPNAPVYIELEDTGFIALAGMPRQGKSATATLLVAQVLLIPDSIVIVCDKHAKKPDSLVSRLAPVAHRIARIAVTADETVAAIDYWHEIGANRLLADDQQKYPPCFLVIDEFTALILLGQLPPATLLKLISAAVEYPKIQTYGLVIGHQWTGKLLGPTLGAPLRRVTGQRIIHHIDPQDAEFLIPPAYAKQCQSLPQGRVIFMGVSQSSPVELSVPYMTADDIAYLARVLPSPPAAQIGALGGSVASVASVASALQSDPHGVAAVAATIDDNDLDPDTDPANSVDLDASSFTTDRRARLAKLLLTRQNAQGKYSFSYRDVQASTNLRTATICALAIEVGRAKNK